MMNRRNLNHANADQSRWSGNRRSPSWPPMVEPTATNIAAQLMQEDGSTEALNHNPDSEADEQ